MIKIKGKEMCAGRILGHNISRIRCKGKDVWLNAPSDVVIFENGSFTEEVSPYSRGDLGSSGNLYTLLTQVLKESYVYKKATFTLDLTNVNKIYAIGNINLSASSGVHSMGHLYLEIDGNLVMLGGTTATQTNASISFSENANYADVSAYKGKKNNNSHFSDIWNTTR